MARKSKIESTRVIEPAQITFKLVVEVNGKERCSTVLGYSGVQNIASEIRDRRENEEILSFLSRHPSARVRECVADKEHLGVDDMHRLAGDQSTRVKCALLANGVFGRVATHDEIMSMIKDNVELACEVAGYLDRYENVEPSKLVAFLAEHPDPEVREQLASGGSCPKSNLRKLAKDADPNVSHQAAEIIESNMF